MKKLLLFLLMLVPMLAQAYNAKINGIYYNFYGSEASVTHYEYGYQNEPYSGFVEIPSSVKYNGKTYSVTSIGADAFSGSGITDVDIPNSVTAIGDNAFWGCYRLNDITLPDFVTSIGRSAFSGCSHLFSVNIGNSVTSIGYDAFRDCYRLTSVFIPNSVTSIGFSAFRGCSGLTSVYIGDLAAWCNISFGNYTSNPCSYASKLFLNGKEINNLLIPNSVTAIGDYAFYNCSGLTSVTIPNSVTSIGSSAFDGCSGLTSVTIGNSVTSIGAAAFNGCSGLTSVTIPNGVTSIGGSAFRECIGLTSVTIPNSVTSIGDWAFYDCSLTSVICLASEPPIINELTFFACGTFSLYVVPGAEMKYSETEYWNRFTVCTIDVSVPITSISLNVTSASLYIGETTALTAAVNPSNATLKDLVWTSSDDSIATVSSNGVVTAKSVGTVTITAKANDGSGKSATCELVVEKEDYPCQPVATDGNTVQYLFNIEAKAFMLGANDWKTRASVSKEKGYQFKVKQNGDGTYTLNDFVETQNAWKAVFAENSSSIWVDNLSGANVNSWVITPVAGEKNVYYISNPSAANGKLGVHSDLADTRLYLTDESGYSVKWAFMNEDDYNAYLIENEKRDRNAAALQAQKELIEGTNVYEESGYNAYVAKYNSYLNNYLNNFNAGNYDDNIVNPNIATKYKASTEYNFLLKPWTIGGNACSAFTQPLYINTWSVEGDTDGSNYHVPFFEYWTNNNKSLAKNNISTTISGKNPGEVYDVTVYARVRIRDGLSNPQGITMTVGNGTPVDLCSGIRVGTSQFYLAEFKAQGSVNANGNLVVNIDVKDGNNISWLAFKNVKYQLSTLTGIEDVMTSTNVSAGQKVYDLSGRIVNTTNLPSGLYIRNGKKYLVK